MTALGHDVGAGRRSSVVLAMPGLLVLSLLGLWRAVEGAWVSVVLLGAAAVVLCVVAFVRPRALERFIRAIGRVASRVVATIAFGLLAVPLVLFPWLVGSLARVDPLWSRPGWGSVGFAGSRATALWRVDEQRLPGSWRARRAAAALGLVALVLVGVVVVPVARSGPETPAAFAGSDWYPEYREDIEWVLGHSNFDPMADVHITDVSTRHVNVVDGARTTWTPPDCEDCVTAEVWFYGGSAAFGVGQRDLHTIPSALARAAWAKGIRLEVVNRGSPGDSHWDAARRLAWDLAGGGSEPDLVVFYDGAEDVRAGRLEVDPIEPPSHVRPDFWQTYLEEYPQPTMVRPASALPSRRRVPEPESETERGSLIAHRYARAREMATAALEEAGVEGRFFWQPGTDRLMSEDLALGLADALPGEVVELSSAFDGVDETLYFDGALTNERGASIAAEVILGHLADDLDRLTASASAAGGSE